MARKRTSKVWFLDCDKFEKLVRESETFTDILKELGMFGKGGNISTLKRRLDDEGLDYSHIKQGSGSNKGKHYFREKIPTDDMLIEDSPNSRSTVKKRIIEEKLIPYECNKCGLGKEWQGEIISLQLDHINGVSNDNRLENLRFLCPNCHSQTKTFAGKSLKKPKKICNVCETNEIHRTNKSGKCSECSHKEKIANTKIDWPDDRELKEMVWLYPLSKISRELKVSGNAIKKRCKRLNIELPEYGYWQRKDASIKIKDSEIEVIKELVWKYPLTYIAEKYEVGVGAVRGFCDRNGIERPPHNHWWKKGTKNKDWEKV